MPGSRMGVLLKIGRAREYGQELERAVRGFLATDPFQLVPEEEAGTGDLVHRVKIRDQPPIELSLILGDAIHNLRTALDHLVWQLVLENGGTPAGNSFPISQNEPAFKKDALTARFLQGISHQAYQLVEATKPWSGGDDQLFALHRLDIEDKHRLLIPVGLAQSDLVVTGLAPRLSGAVDPPLEVTMAWPVKERQFPLRDGAMVFRIKKAARGAPWFEERLTFDVAFGDGTIVTGEPLVPTIPRLIDHVERVCQPLLALLSS